jgi:hypothetical protein
VRLSLSLSGEACLGLQTKFRRWNQAHEVHLCMVDALALHSVPFPSLLPQYVNHGFVILASLPLVADFRGGCPRACAPQHGAQGSLRTCQSSKDRRKDCALGRSARHVTRTGAQSKRGCLFASSALDICLFAPGGTSFAVFVCVYPPPSSRRAYSSQRRKSTGRERAARPRA